MLKGSDSGCFAALALQNKLMPCSLSRSCPHAPNFLSRASPHCLTRWARKQPAIVVRRSCFVSKNTMVQPGVQHTGLGLSLAQRFLMLEAPLTSQ